MDPEPKETGKKGRILFWIIGIIFIFGASNALAFSDSYKTFISNLKESSVVSWNEIKGNNKKLVAEIDLAAEEIGKTEEESVLAPATSTPKKVKTTYIKKKIVTRATSSPPKIIYITASTSSSTDEIVEPSSTATSSEKKPEENLENPLITIVQISGGSGKTSNDFINIFNPNWKEIDVSGWKLRKRTQSGSESSMKVFPDGSIIPAKGNFIWANSKDGYNNVVGSNISSASTISTNNSIALISKDGLIKDALAWGEGLSNPFVEGSPIFNPGTGQVIMRKFNKEVPLDFGDNFADFELK